MPYVHFWHQYAQHAAAEQGSGIDLGAVLGVLACLILLAGWAAHQARSRCRQCGSWPAQCRCGRRDARSR